MTGALLLIPLAVEGATIPFIGQLLTVHIFVGLLLLAPVGLKLASTGYRLAGYYGGRDAYVRKGPPLTPLRILAVWVVVSTLVLIGVLVALLYTPGSCSR